MEGGVCCSYVKHVPDACRFINIVIHSMSEPLTDAFFISLMNWTEAELEEQKSLGDHPEGTLRVLPLLTS